MTKRLTKGEDIHWIKHDSIGLVFRTVQIAGIFFDLPLAILAAVLFAFTAVSIPYSIAADLILWVGWKSSSNEDGIEAFQSLQTTALVDSVIFLGSSNLELIINALAATILLIYVSYVRSNTILPARDFISLSLGAICAFSVFFPVATFLNSFLEPFGQYSSEISQWQIEKSSEWAESLSFYIENLERTKVTRTVALQLLFLVVASIPLLLLGTIMFFLYVFNRVRLGGLSKRSKRSYFTGIAAGLSDSGHLLCSCLAFSVAGPIVISFAVIVFITFIEQTSPFLHAFLRNYCSSKHACNLIGEFHLYLGSSISIAFALSFGSFLSHMFKLNGISLKASLSVSVLLLLGAVVVLLVNFFVINPQYHWGLLLFTLFIQAIAVPAVWTYGALASFATAFRRFKSARQRSLASHRTPWLFLRAFSLDAKSVAWPFDTFRAIPILGRRKYRLEHVIAEAVFRFGPIIAVGNPSDPKGDHGIPREYLSDQDWQPFVEDSIEKYRGTVFLIGDGSHVAWETEKLIEFGALRKTIFVAPPQIHDGKKYLDSVRELSIESGIPLTVLDLVGSGDCIAFYWGTKGWTAILNRRRSAHDYRMAIHKALYDASQLQGLSAL